MYLQRRIWYTYIKLYLLVITHFSFSPFLPLSLSPSLPLSLSPSLPPSLSPSLPPSLSLSFSLSLFLSQCILFTDILVFAHGDSKSSKVELVLPLEALWIEDLEDRDPQTSMGTSFPLILYTLFICRNYRNVK